MTLSYGPLNSNLIDLEKTLCTLCLALKLFNQVSVSSFIILFPKRAATMKTRIDN